MGNSLSSECIGEMSPYLMSIIMRWKRDGEMLSFLYGKEKVQRQHFTLQSENTLEQPKCIRVKVNMSKLQSEEFSVTDMH